MVVADSEERAGRMMKDCGAPAVERLGLEGLTEEGDASVVKDSSRRNAPESGSCCQVGV